MVCNNQIQPSAPSWLTILGGYTDNPHGAVFGFLLGAPLPGINKDRWVVPSKTMYMTTDISFSLACGWSPHFEYHTVAVGAATDATVKFIESISDDITDSQLRLLFGVGPTIAIVMDTT
jgi:hypothetical protein